MRQYDEQSKTQVCNPYIDSLEQVGSPDPQLERRKKKEMEAYLDPTQDNFGVITRSENRFDREKKHQLMHRTTNTRAITQVKTNFRNEEPHLTQSPNPF